MRAKHHIAMGAFFIIFLGIFTMYLNPYMGSSLLEKNLLNIESVIIGIILYFVGLILPDSDSDNSGSKIFHTPFFPLAYICKVIEIPLAKKLGRVRGHRGSMHTLVGVFVSSLIVSSIVSIILIPDKAFVVLTIPFLFFMTFLGQL